MAKENIEIRILSSNPFIRFFQISKDKGIKAAIREDAIDTVRNASITEINFSKRHLSRILMFPAYLIGKAIMKYIPKTDFNDPNILYLQETKFFELPY